MRTPFNISLVSCAGVFLPAFLVGIFHHDSIDGHVLTPLEEFPQALVLATVASALALLGAWLGLRHADSRCLTYRLGLGIALVYVMATSVANALTSSPPRTVVVPSHEFAIESVQLLLFGSLWGIGAPWLIAWVLKRFNFFRASGA
ncbi:MAG: hypothetical protein JSR66_01220 [Proteobacteria bacterium]|nr:hypothetical protein [Pseudomonadota bacterium]